MERSRWGYRLMTTAEHASLRATGEFASALDARDGYIHLSPASALADTCRLYYAGADDVMLLRVDLAAGALRAAPRRLQWDAVPSRGCDFPHIYGGSLPAEAVHRVWGPLPRDAASGAHILPTEQELAAAN